MEGMFKECSKLKKLDISNFNFENLSNASYMFSDCRSLKELNLPKFKNKKKINVDYMLSLCSNKLKNEIKNLNNGLGNEAFMELNNFALPL